MKEYTHVVIDKFGTGLDSLRQLIDANGIQTAHQRNIALAEGSRRLEHHLHVFLWDDGVPGVKGRRGIEAAGNCFLVRVRWPVLTESGIIFSGSLQGDNMHSGPPSGVSTNGAWAYKGSIPRKFCYIEGLDTPDKDGFASWREGRGWP
jgi:hypothetical protein